MYCFSVSHIIGCIKYDPRVTMWNAQKTVSSVSYWESEHAMGETQPIWSIHVSSPEDISKHFIVRYHQSTFTPFYLLYINMTLKNILRWENSKATVGPCCLINRDFKRQCRISMVLQGSAKGQARGVEERGGKDRYLWTVKRNCVESKHGCLSTKINTNRHEGVKQQSPKHRCIKLQIFWFTNCLQNERQDIQLCQRKCYSIKSKDKKRWQLKLMSLVREGTKSHS